MVLLVITSTSLPLKLFRKGKVRDTYDYGQNLLMVATDRLSAFDVVFNEGIPFKGIILTQLSLFWFDKLKDLVKNHLISTEIPSVLPKYLKDRSMIVKRAKPLPAEFIVRGYLAGSGLKDYLATGKISGIELPSGLKNSSKLPHPILTPSTKAEKGHDQNITAEELKALIGEETYAKAESMAIKIYKRAAEFAEEKGIILADTKFEFGKYEDDIILIDEVLTPDSSRYWPKERYKEGENQESYDKQYVRDYLEKIGWNKQPPPPSLPQHIIENTSKKYIEIYTKLTGKHWDFGD
ncbi:MAG: phosphoribosylaminoimidazolesuccinocarboxamide synthase [Candidatus Anstonellales archaeon]